MNNTKPTTLGEAFDSSKPIKITLDKEYTLTPLKIADIYPAIEADIKTKSIKDAQLVAQSLEQGERIEFMMQVWKQLPKGEELEQKVSDFIQSLEGIQKIFLIALEKIGVKFTLTQLEEYINIESLVNYLLAFYDLIGVSPAEEDSKSSKK